MEEPFLLPDLTPYPLTVSLGVATLDRETISVDELVARADAAIYEAKRAGRDHVSCASVQVDTERHAS